MSKRSEATAKIPPQATAALRTLGEHLAIARLRRRESQRLWAKRLAVSIPTLIRMEQGDPAVGMGVYVTALWLIGRVSALSELADPKHDMGALELDVRQASKRRAPRAKASIAARLNGEAKSRNQ